MIKSWKVYAIQALTLTGQKLSEAGNEEGYANTVHMIADIASVNVPAAPKADGVVLMSKGAKLLMTKAGIHLSLYYDGDQYIVSTNEGSPEEIVHHAMYADLQAVLETFQLPNVPVRPKSAGRVGIGGFGNKTSA